ncbi:MAG: hypothetical protein LUE86_10715 [Clostridiales bacterium]|nr:hypothetical protein [Clostridiales bacterium]
MKRIRQMMTIMAAAAVLLSPSVLGRLDERLALTGVEDRAAFPAVTAKRLFSGEAQTELETYLQQRQPGKPFMVRLRNEITFSLLHTVSNINYSMSRDRDLFSWENVSWYLQYFIPISEEGADELLGKLTRLRDMLEASGRQLYIFITPCKIRYREDELPWVDKAMAPERGMGNYDQLVRVLEDSDLNWFDSVAYIEVHEQEFDSRVPLYYRTGLHWSTYVGNTVGAAFGDYLEEKSGFRLPDITVTAQPCETPVYPDADSFGVFNVLSEPYDQYYEPVITVTDPSTDAPGFLCRGGSFMGQSLAMLIQNHCFGKNVDMENRQIFTEEFSQVKEFTSYEDEDMAAYLKDIDIVVLEVNETSVTEMGFGFIDYVLEHPEILQEEQVAE